jgi:hypothetical protein
MTAVEITTRNIEDYRGSLTIGPRDLPPVDLWAIFDYSAFYGRSNGLIVPLETLVSFKNELVDGKFLSGEKPDPRQTAFHHMMNAVKGGQKRAPLSVRNKQDGNFIIVDGNATAQALMLLGWAEVPVLVEVA